MVIISVEHPTFEFHRVQVGLSEEVQMMFALSIF